MKEVLIYPLVSLIIACFCVFLLFVVAYEPMLLAVSAAVSFLLLHLNRRRIDKTFKHDQALMDLAQMRDRLAKPASKEEKARDQRRKR